MGQTYQELLLATDGVFSPNNEFIDINKESIVGLRLQDYDFFWGCMKLYDIYGINYFKKYMDITMERFGDFSGGIEEWLAYYGRDIKEIELFSEREIGYREGLSDLIYWMHFFGLSHYGRICISDLERLLEATPELYRAVYDKALKQRNANKAKNRDNKIANYYNFENFSTQTFSNYVKIFTTRESKTIMSINDALKTAKNIPRQSYIVLLYKNNRICFIGKTEQLLAYIGLKNKKCMADSVIFDSVDKAYIDDVLLAVKIFYHYPLDGVRITKVNRKYVTIKNACFVHKEKEDFPKKALLDIIYNKLQVTRLGNGQEIIDKIALEHILHNSKI